MVNVLMTGQEIRDRDGRELELESELAALRAQVKKDTGRIDALVALNEQKNRELAVSQAECGRLREAAAQLLQVQSLLDVTRSALESNLRAQLAAAEERARKVEAERDDMDRAMVEARRRRDEVMCERDYWMDLPRNRKLAAARAEGVRDAFEWAWNDGTINDEYPAATFARYLSSRGVNSARPDDAERVERVAQYLFDSEFGHAGVDYRMSQVRELVEEEARAVLDADKKGA
jgi:hypothetical protein